MNFAGHTGKHMMTGVCDHWALVSFASLSEVSFQRKNSDFLLKNPDLLIRNPDFLLKDVDFIMKILIYV